MPVLAKSGLWQFACRAWYAGAQVLAGALYLASAQDRPAWLAKPPSLDAPAGVQRRVATADDLITAAETLPDGATLSIEPGTYELPRPVVLRQRRGITIRSATGDPGSVVLRGRGWELGDERDDLIRVADCDGVRIVALTFADCRSYAIKVEAEHAPRDIHILHCRFRNIGVRAIKGSASQDPAVRAIKGSVRFCDFENTRLPPPDWLFGGDYMAAIDMMALEDWVFADNSFRGIRGRMGGGRAAIFVWVRSRRIVIERNFMFDCDRGIALGNPGDSTANARESEPRHASDAVVQNNVIVGGADCGIELWHADGIRVRHNSIWRPKQNWNRGIRVGRGVAASELVNNLVHGEIRIEGGDVRMTHNLTGRLEGTWRRPEQGDLGLLPAAQAAINRGLVLPDVTHDAAGRERDARPDLGAFEYFSKP